MNPLLHQRPAAHLAGVAVVMTLAAAAGCWTDGPHDAAEAGTDDSAARTDASTGNATDITPPVIPDGVFAAFKTGADAQADLCFKDNLHPTFPNDADIFLQVFCAASPPQPHSLQELESVLGLGFKNPSGDNGVGGNPGFVLMGHSASLVGRFVSAINPRAILFTPSGKGSYVALAYSRGDPFVEVAANDPVTGNVVFYLVRLQQDCPTSGCAPSDVLTLKAEKNWQAVTSYEGTTAPLNTSIFDCMQCHQPNYQNGNGPRILRMQESSAPYTHYFSTATEGGRALLQDFHAAHGSGEDYAGIPATMIDKSDPALLQGFIADAGFAQQPNPFDSAKVEAEVRASAPMQPSINLPMGASPTWSAAYEQAVSGQSIGVPYHDVKVTDPAKLSAATTLYQSVALGQAPPSALTDIRAVFLDEGLRDMGFAPKAGLTAPQLFTQACGQCHNSRLNPQTMRAHFNVDLLLAGTLTKNEIPTAIDLLSVTDPTDIGMMPPPVIRTLTAAERNLLIEYLKNY